MCNVHINAWGKNSVYEWYINGFFLHDCLKGSYSFQVMWAWVPGPDWQVIETGGTIIEKPIQSHGREIVDDNDEM